MLMCCGVYMPVGVSADVETKVVSGDEYSICSKVFYGKQEYIVCCRYCVFHFHLNCL